MRFVALVWLSTRVAIVLALAVSAPHGFVDALGHWDGAWYGSIVAHGYSFSPDGSQHNIAFFPVYPLVCRALTAVAIPWPIAGAIVSNIAFFGSLCVVYAYARNRFDERTARALVIVMCVLPLSLFCTVAYSESLFMLFAALSLWAFDRKRYALAGVAAAAASATRPLGTALALGSIAATVVERRGVAAIAAVSLGLAGIAAFCAFCAVKFGDALAFVHAQPAWRHTNGLAAGAWLGLRPRRTRRARS